MPQPPQPGDYVKLLPTSTDELSINQCVPMYLALSVAYYFFNRSMVSDDVFDAICYRLLHEWDDITHPHKYLITYDSLSAGTGFDIEFHKLPTMARISIGQLIEDFDSSIR
jgi:NAD-dependent DNA ligase